MWKIFWLLASPIWLYVRFSPFNKGKGFLVKNILIPIIPKEGFMESSILGKAKIKLGYAGALGRWMLIDGIFEKAEIQYVIDHLKKGDMAYDIGANIGYFTVIMGVVVSGEGKISSFEPMPNNLVKLKENIILNNLKNITINEIALSDRTGEIQMHSPVDDLAFASIYTPDNASTNTGNIINVKTDLLDNIWTNSGEPDISVIKLDVEGAEVAVLKGALNCLKTCKPKILLEANSEEEFNSIRKIIEPLNYTYYQPKGFKKWNWVFFYDAN